MADNHEVIVLSRDPSAHRLPDGVTCVKWDGRTGAGWAEYADGAFAVINLAGENIGGTGTLPTPGTWSAQRRQAIRESRKNAGAAVVEAVTAARARPQVVFQMSGVDYYPTGDRVATETSSRGQGFLADVVADYWEPSTAPIEALGLRRVVARTAPLLSLDTGPLPPSLLQFRLFVGGRLGSGKQWLSWIHIDDAVRAIRFLTDNETAQGVFNVASPNPVTNETFTKTLGKVMGRPSILPVPEFALKAMLGDVSSLVLDGRPVSVEKLQGLGFSYLYPDLDSALRNLLQK